MYGSSGNAACAASDDVLVIWWHGLFALTDSDCEFVRVDSAVFRQFFEV